MTRQVNDLVRWEGYDYFVGQEDYRLYRMKTGATGTPQALVDERVSGYIVTDSGIYYSLHSPDAGYPGAGLYKVGLDGTRNKLIVDARNVQSLIHVGNWILFESWDDTNNLVFIRLDIQTDEITVFE